MGEKLTIYWEFGQTGLKYINGKEAIPFKEVTRRASQGHYSQIVDEWSGPIPVNLWMEMKAKKNDLEKFVKQG